MTEETPATLESQLLAITGSVTVIDPFLEIRWVAPAQGTNLEAFCRGLEGLQGNARNVTLPYPEELKQWLDKNGGDLVHLAVQQHESGLVSAVVHNSNHKIVLYGGKIFECRGMKNGHPDIAYPFALNNLSKNPTSEGADTNGFFVKLTSGVLSIGGKPYPAYFTSGAKTISPTGDRRDVVELLYDIATPILAPEEVFPDLITRLSLTLDTRLLKGTITLEMKVAPAYVITMNRDLTSFYFGATGKLERAWRVGLGDDSNLTIPITGDRAPLIFDVCFNAGRVIPTIDIQASIRKMLQPFTHHAMPYGISGTDGSPNTLQGWMVYRQPETQQAPALSVAVNA